MSDDPCPDLDVLAEVAAGEEADSGTGAHLDRCDSCSRRLALVRRAIAAGVWDDAIAAAAEEVRARRRLTDIPFH